MFTAGTTNTILSVTTNEAATCKYSTSDQSYSSMINTFTNTGNIIHSTTIMGLTDGQSYNYYVRCKDTAGNAMTTSQSISFSVANPINQIYITSCQNINSPGNYIVQNDLNGMGAATCLDVHDTNGVYINCANKVISVDGSPSSNVVNINNINGFSLRNCTLKANNAPAGQGGKGLWLSNSQNGIITNNTFTGNALVNAQGSSNLQVTNNNFTNSLYQQSGGSNNNRIESNKFDFNYNGAGLIVSVDGSGNSIKNNFIDGHGTGQPSTAHTGFDDGIILQTESQDTVSGNILQNFWDCGIENAGLIKETTISNNTIKNAAYCGIGGWYWNSLQSNTFSQNKVDNSGTLFTFSRIYPLLPGENFVYFTNNLFISNILTNINNIRGYATDIEMAHNYFGQISDNKFIASNDTFTNNDFGTGPGPFIDPISAVVDGGGNKCGPPSLGQTTSPLGCN